MLHSLFDNNRDPNYEVGPDPSRSTHSSPDKALLYRGERTKVVPNHEFVNKVKDYLTEDGVI